MKHTVWHYVLPSIKGEGWAEVFITSRGVFSTVSDWGNYGYVWTHTGHDDVRKFFLNPKGREDYFIGKLGMGVDDVFDADLTRRGLLEMVKTIEEPEVRKELRAAVRTAYLSTQESFYEIVGEWANHYDVPVEAFYASIALVPDRQVTAFVKKVMPRLAKMIEKDLKA